MNRDLFITLSPSLVEKETHQFQRFSRVFLSTLKERFIERAWEAAISLIVEQILRECNVIGIGTSQTAPGICVMDSPP